MSRLVVLVALAMALAFALPDNTEAANLNEIKKLTASDAQAGDNFGLSVAVSGDTAVVGAPREDAGGIHQAGAAYVFDRDQGGPGNWGEVKKLLAADATAFDQLGLSVAVSGDTAIVGEIFGGSDRAGAAHVFQRDHGGADNWGEVKEVRASDAAGGDWFGYGVAMSGDTAIVGAFQEDAGGNLAGAAYVFQRDRGGADNWGEVKKLTASDAYADDWFGFNVAVSGDSAIVGAQGEDAAGYSAGAAYIFQRDEGGADNWGEVKKLIASDAQVSDNFGHNVAMSGDTTIVGALLEDGDAGFADEGAAYVFQRNQGGPDNWGEVSKLTASDGQNGDRFGFGVAVSVDAAVVGAYQEDAGGSDAGAAYVFKRNEGGPDNWGEVTKLAASDAQPDDWFGLNVAVAGDTGIVGALQEDALGSDAGAAYVFDLLLTKPTATPTTTNTPTITPTPPPPIGGIALEADLRALPLQTGDPESAQWLAMIAAIAAIAGLVALGGAAWYARRRWLT